WRSNSRGCGKGPAAVDRRRVRISSPCELAYDTSPLFAGGNSMSGPLFERTARVSYSIFDLCHYPFETDPHAFDPALASRVYDEHMEEWLEAERLGFDAIFLTEHHYTAYKLAY